MSDSDSYLEQCIAALPPEKREAARRAFAEISETGDDSYLSKLLTVLEANNAYARTIPKNLADVSGKLFRDMTEMTDKLAHQQSQDEGRREASFKKLVAEQFAELAKTLALDKVAVGIEKQRVILEQLKRPASEPEADGWTGVLCLMGLAFIAGAAFSVWLLREPYNEARQAKSFLDRVADAGIELQLEPTKTANKVIVAGPGLKTATYFTGADGSVAGIEINFGKPK
jgi:hypothetical protein